MKKLLSLLLLIAVLIPMVSCGNSTPESTTVSVTTPPPADEEVPSITLPLKVMTFNLRYETASHPLMAISQRGPRFISLMEKYQPDSIGLCEITNDWMNFLRTQMKKLGYAYVGVGRDDGKDSPSASGSGNEHNPVFYKADKFDLLEGDTLWLSNTPGKSGSNSWSSACNRICSWVVLKDKETGLIYAHMNTHLDHVSTESHPNAVRIIQAKMESLKATYGDIGVVLTGDFNSVAYDGTNPSYRPITYRFATSFMDDSQAIAQKTGEVGSTFSGYQNPDDWERGHASNNDKPAVDTSTSPIDFIFLTKGAFDVPYYTVVNDVFTFEYNGKTYHNHPVSDHYGVYAEVVYKPGKATAPDESKAIDHTAKLSADLPSSLTALTNVAANATLTSGLSCNASLNVDKLKTEDGYAQLSTRLIGEHYYWEITARLKKYTEIAGVSFLCADDKLPAGAECFVSSDGYTWEKVGGCYMGQMSAGERVTWTLDKAAVAGYVKIVLFDCPDLAKLASIAIYGTETDAGPLPLSPVSGPKSGQGEGYEKMVDGTTSTKFYINIAKDTLTPLIYRTDSPATAKRYIFTTANDNAQYGDRVAIGWVLSASTDGENWVVIDNVPNAGLEHKDFERYTFNIDSPGEYTYYKLEFSLPTSGRMQFSEFVLES